MKKQVIIDALDNIEGLKRLAERRYHKSKKSYFEGLADGYEYATRIILLNARIADLRTPDLRKLTEKGRR